MTVDDVLVERADVLAILDGHLEAASTGRGRLVLLRGEAGVGKSAVVRHLADRANGRTRVLQGACDALSTPSPLGPLLDIAGDLGADLEQVLDEALRGSDSPQAVFRALLAELRQAHPCTLFIVEDLHWADGATLDLLRYLARRIAEIPVLVLGTYRDDEVGREHPLTVLLGDLAGLPTVRRTSVEPLTRAAVDRLATDACVDAAELYRATGGNPFFVTEVIAAGSTELPASVSEVVLGRLARMPECDRRVAEAVAVIGSPAEVPLIRALVPAGPDDLASVLDHGLLQAVGDGIAFRHELARLAVWDAVPGYRRVDLHGRALAALRSQAKPGEQLAHLAHHAEGAGDSAAVLEFAPAAGERAAALRAHTEAAAQYARALRHCQGLPAARRAWLLEEHSREAYLSSDVPAAIASREAAVRLRGELADPRREGDDLRWLAHMLRTVGRVAEAAQAADAAELLLEPLPPCPERAELYLHRCLDHSYRADVEGTRRYARLVVALSEHLGDPGLALQARYYVARAEVSRTGRGWDEVERALEDAIEADLEERTGFLFMTASAVASLHRDRRGRAVMQRAEEYCAAHDMLTYLLATRAHGVLHPLHEGRWADAADAARAIVAHPRAAPIVRAPALATIGLVRARWGDPDWAAPLDEAAGLLEPDLVLHMTPVWEARAEAAWLLGDDERARAESHRGLALLGEHSDPWLCGGLARWVRLAGGSPPPYPAAGPYALELAGDWRGAAAAWDELGCSYDAALALLSGDTAAVLRALAIFESLDARAAAGRARSRLRSLGVRPGLRGPRPATRSNLHGLTIRQAEILGLVAEGLNDTAIAARLHLSAKTVNHHVTATLAKLGVHSRADAVRKLASAGAAEPYSSHNG